MRSLGNKYLTCHEYKLCNCSITEYCILALLLGLTIKNILIKKFFFTGGNDNFKKHLCIYGCTGSLSLHSIFLQLQLVESPLWVCGLLTVASLVEPGLQTPGFSSSANRFSCFMACGIFPHQGLNLCPLHWQAKFLSTVPPWISEMVV